MRKPLIYIAHPVSGQAKANAQNALAWTKWFVQNDENRIYIAPWLGEVLSHLDDKMDAEFYQRILDDDCDTIARFNGLIAVGGPWSPGMLQERQAARSFNLPIIDWTRFRAPPANFGSTAKDVLQELWKDANPNTWRPVEPY